MHTIVVLLRSKAVHKNLSGNVSYSARPDRGKMVFVYEVVRLWKRPANRLLASALGLTPLAVLGELPARVALEDGFRSVVGHLIERLNREASPEQARKLLTSAYVLAGLRVEQDVARTIFQGVQAMHESTTYLAIMDEGAEKVLKQSIFRNGQRRFGPADATTRTRLEAITEDVARLDRMVDRLVDGSATGWDDLLATP